MLRVFLTRISSTIFELKVTNSSKIIELLIAPWCFACQLRNRRNHTGPGPGIFLPRQLPAEKLAEVFEKWIKGKFVLLFYTSWFRVRINYSSVTLFFHYDGIRNILDFVQEPGQAGRNSAPARLLVLLTTNWNSNFNRMVAGETQAVVEY
ncbi:hypothetical protein V1504DRAFT_397848 [Lipomyces starkeyi]